MGIGCILVVEGMCRRDKVPCIGSDKNKSTCPRWGPTLELKSIKEVLRVKSTKP